MRNNPYHKKLKDHLPLMMRGPSSISALISDEIQKDFVEKAMQLSIPESYQVRGVSFTMISPPILNRKGTFNTDLLNVEMGQTEVTQELFQAVMGWNNSNHKSSLKNPVENVTWYDCMSFCNKLSNLSGLEECYKISDVKMDKVHIEKAKVTWDESKNGFRLPTEYEWRFFAKAGTNNEWSGTNDVNKLEQYAWFRNNANMQTHPVAELLPNEWGLYDMSGNVEEWCRDFYDYDSDDDNMYEKIVSRGGALGYAANNCRITSRSRNDSEELRYNLGFRLCRSLG